MSTFCPICRFFQFFIFRMPFVQKPNRIRDFVPTTQNSVFAVPPAERRRVWWGVLTFLAPVRDEAVSGGCWRALEAERAGRAEGALVDRAQVGEAGPGAGGAGVLGGRPGPRGAVVAGGAGGRPPLLTPGAHQTRERRLARLTLFQRRQVVEVCERAREAGVLRLPGQVVAAWAEVSGRAGAVGRREPAPGARLARRAGHAGGEGLLARPRVHRAGGARRRRVGARLAVEPGAARLAELLAGRALLLRVLAPGAGDRRRRGAGAVAAARTRAGEALRVGVAGGAVPPGGTVETLGDGGRAQNLVVAAGRTRRLLVVLGARRTVVSLHARELDGEAVGGGRAVVALGAGRAAVRLVHRALLAAVLPTRTGRLQLPVQTVVALAALPVGGRRAGAALGAGEAGVAVGALCLRRRRCELALGAEQRRHRRRRAHVPGATRQTSGLPAEAVPPGDARSPGGVDVRALLPDGTVDARHGVRQRVGAGLARHAPLGVPIGAGVAGGALAARRPPAAAVLPRPARRLRRRRHAGTREPRRALGALRLLPDRVAARRARERVGGDGEGAADAGCAVRTGARRARRIRARGALRVARPGHQGALPAGGARRAGRLAAARVRPGSAVDDGRPVDIRARLARLTARTGAGAGRGIRPCNHGN